MATIEDDLKRIQREKEAEKINPLLKLGLGDLVRKSQGLASVLGVYAFRKDIEEIPGQFREIYADYQLVIQELNRRERDYTRIPISEQIYGQRNL